MEYTDRGSEITVNGAVISTAASVPTYVTSSVYNQATSINADRDNSGDYTVEFAERYQPDLTMDRDTVNSLGGFCSWARNFIMRPPVLRRGRRCPPMRGIYSRTASPAARQQS